MPPADVEQLQAALRTADAERRLFLRGLMDLWYAVKQCGPYRIPQSSDLVEVMAEVREVIVKFVENPVPTTDPDQYFR